MKSLSRKTEIYQVLKQKLDNKEFPPGTKLPKELELAEQLGVSRKTLRAALEALELENRIERIRGEGTFVRGGQNSHQIRVLAIQPESHHISNPSPFIFQGARLAAENQNIVLESCYFSSLESCPPPESAQHILRSGIQGIIALGDITPGSALYETLQLTHLPVIFPHSTSCYREPTEFAYMGTDYAQVLRDGLLYLAAQGHHRVGHISSGTMRDVATADYFQFVRDARLDDDPRLLFRTQSSTDVQEIAAGVDYMLDQLPQPPTAIFCFSDFFALCIYQQLKQRKIAIPEQMAVLTIGGLLGCDYLDPPLSSIDFDPEGIGRLAILQLLKMIEEKRTALPPVVTAHHIHERQSTRYFLHRQ